MNKPNTTPIRIVIADDHLIFRKGLIASLLQVPHFELVGIAGNGEELITVVENQKPDVVLTDIKMPIMDGVKATSIIHNNFPDIGVIALSMFEDKNIMLQLVRAGARGYLLKNISQEDMVLAIKTVNQDKSYYFTSSISGLLRQDDDPYYLPNLTLLKFTDKELEVMKLICMEYSNKEIANMTGSSLRSVESAKERIQKKTNSKNAVGIALFALVNRIVKVVK